VTACRDSGVAAAYSTLTQALPYAAIPDELRELIATKPYYHEGLREVASKLPADDAELHQWLADAAAAMDENTFVILFAAAAMAERKLQPSLLTAVMTFRISPWHLAWVAWRMEGEVTEELRFGLASSTLSHEMRAVALFVAAAWWLEHRNAEELPRWIMHGAKELSEEKKIDLRTASILIGLGALLGTEEWFGRLGNPRKTWQLKGMSRGSMKKMLALLKGPFEKLIHERRKNEFSGGTMHRSVEHVGPNARCPCGSGKKYKRCCHDKDQERLRDSSTVEGVTRTELAANVGQGLTMERLQKMRSSELVQLDPLKIPEELQQGYFAMLQVLKRHDKIIEAFEKVGVPDHLRDAWSHAFSVAADSWRPDLARKLMEVFPDAEEKLGIKPHAGIRVLLVGNEPEKVLVELEATARHVLKSRDIEDLRGLLGYVLSSPYSGLGILLTRSALPIVKEKHVAELFEAILEARAKLDLSPDDEFSEWMDEKALRKAQKHESAAMQEAQDQFEANKEKLRHAQEELARLERELALRKKHERREETHATAVAAPDEQTQRENRELKVKVDRANVLVAEQAELKLASRRLVEKLTLENEALLADRNAAAAEEADEERDGEEFKVSGTQPVRLIGFTNEFSEAVKKFSPNVGRAAMNRLGRIASGEPSAFDRLKSIVALPGVVEARVADRYRLLFSLEPERVRVVDLVYRPNLDRVIERYKLTGLPAML
jgi:hypothetical protein